ncbi:hypothetical protein BJ944DRAFT_162028 [Cunninghamella echinulata]|nr:hypothetical protein BJ944DRAFT_162028 [Cunninghamella echinulata]
MRPLQSRTIPFSVMDDGNGQQQHNLEEFQNIAAILRYRATSDNHRLASAFTVLDSKGKEPASLSWEKLNARAEKIAVQFRDKKSGIQSGDRVALIYRKSEVLEFIVALFGCFLAGVVAIPINAADDLSELSFILNLTNANLILTTEFNHRAFIKDIQTRSLDFPANIDWWKTDSFGTWYPSKKAKEYASIKAVELAYIEYAKAVNGELKGVIVTHHSIMEEGRMYKAGITDTTVSINQNDQTLDVQPKRQQYSGFDTVVTYLEPRQQVGLVLSVLCSVYSGNHTVFTSGSIVDTPATWIYVISKYKATIALADYPALNNITQYYQNNAKEVRNHSKKVAPDLSSLRYLFIDSSISKPDLNNFIAEKLLRPLGNNDNPMKVVCPILSLPEHGGMILSFRDNLGPAQLETFGQDQDHRSVFAEGNSNDIWECLLDAEALKSNKVVLVAAGEGARTARTDSHETLVSSFGFVIPDATVAIVDPDTTTLCPPDTLGEVWIDAPSISGGFWSLPRHSEAIFHAKPTIIPPDTMYPEIYNQEFLRTGLVGTLIGGRLVTFGNYEDRIRQQRFGDVHGSEEIFFATDIIDTIETRVKNDKCTVFDITINDQHLPIVACESNAPRTELPALTLEIEESLLELHGLRPFAIFVVAVNGLPRQLKHGRRQIHSLMTKRSFLNGQLTIRSLRMDVDRTIFNVASNDESVVSVWHSGITYERALRQRVIIPFQQQQHTGMETIRSVIDERTEYDLSKFTNIIDILQWRTAVHPEETAFVGLSHNGSGSVETKPYSWRKINYTIASVATYLNKRGFKRGHKALLVIPFSVDWILAIYACLAIGVTPIPMEVPDPQQQQVQRIKDDVEAILTTARDLNVTYVIVNNHSENILKNKPVNPPMRQLLTSTFKGYKLPEYTNINKASKHHKLLGKESGISFRPEWLIGEYSISPLIISQVSTNGKRYYTALRHETIINQCRVQKTTCQLKSQRGIVATGLGACDSIGLLHSTFCGVYIGCITVMVPTEEYYLNPFSFFEMIQRYKAKDICVTLPLMQYAMNRMGPNNEQRRLNLRTTVQNIMLTTEGRPRPLFYQHLARFFTLHRLEKEALNTVYSHFTNPMITTRSYMLVEPIVLIADQYWLRRGIIRSLPVEEESRGIVLTDSGIVPSNTMVAIVNPETHALCPSNVVGEIWVSSDCNADHLLNCGNDNGASILEASLPGADPRIKYVRTGDLGFLWNVQRRGNPMEPTLEEGQCLYVLGPKWEVLERNGLMHFPGDVEATIERCHPAIPAGGSVVIQVDKEIIALVTVKSKEFATSATPLIVSSVVENHSFLIDTVIILLPNNLPRSRYGEKQRDKALTAYAEKKL